MPNIQAKQPTIALNLRNIQGNSLGGFNKDHQSNLFLKFRNADAAREWIKDIADTIANSSSADVIQFNNQFSTMRAQGVRRPETLISAVWTNLVFSWRGLAFLNVADRNALPDDFKQGMKARGPDKIGDTGESGPDNWIDPFKNPDDVHALLIVAADHPHELARTVQQITSNPKFQAAVTISLNQPGNTRPDLPGHEHFGFKDGISQPGVKGVDPPDDPIGNPTQGHPGQDLLWPGEFVIGYATQVPKADPEFDGPNQTPGPDSASGPSWTRDGCYLVFRRLRQNVPAFEQEVARIAGEFGWHTDLAGAKLVGRYKSGVPIEQRKFQPGPYTPPAIDPGTPVTGNPALGNSSGLNNNFEFGADTRGAICPVAAHVRKAYPRDEFTPAGKENSESSTQTRRILRRGIPYGAPYVPNDPDSAKVDRGLLFLCYQNSITNHFEFIQQTWVDSKTFPPPDPDAKPLADEPGDDPIIAQSANGTILLDPDAKAVPISHFVQTTGGEYFFSPSIDVLKRIGTRQL
jgi:Dyp-type peroxidase family